MAEEDTRVFVPDPTPEGMDPVAAEWIIRQLYRIAGSSGLIADRQNADEQKLDDHLVHATGPVTNPHNMMRWRKEWVGGVDYLQYDVVEKAFWLMIANKTTQDDPQPQPAGDRRWLTGLGDTPTWVNTTSPTANQIIVGMRVNTPADTAYFRYTARIWIPAGTVGMSLALWLVVDPLGNRQIDTILPERIIQAGEDGAWFTVNLGTDFVPLGIAFDLLAVFASESTPTSWSDQWDAKRKNDADVSDGEVWHGSDQAIGSRFSYIAEGQNREIDLKALNPGDEVELLGAQYDITDLEPDDGNNNMQIWTQPHMRPQEDEYTYIFTSKGATQIPYVDNGDAWASYPDIQGLFSDTGFNEITTDQKQYGIDLDIESVTASPDWDFMAFSD